MATVSEGAWLSIEDVESAINRYRRVHEPQGDEWFVMDRSLSQMAHVYGQMIVDRSSGVYVESLNTEVGLLLLEWKGP